MGAFVKYRQRDVVVGACMVLLSWSFFNIGRITANHTEPVTIMPGQGSELTQVSPKNAVPLDVRVVVSKNSSSMKYHYSWCGSGKRIKPENQVWFETAATAEAAGYTLAGNCQ